jgi:phosphate transport system substrate-binding protein
LRSKRRVLGILALLTSFSLVAAACGDDDDDAGSGDSEATGDVFISGSSTVEPISVRVAELFADVNSNVNVDVEGPGTGDGFAVFCEGETEISDASRAINEEEVATCEANDIAFIELPIAYDGLTVLTNPNNDAVECLNFVDLYALTGPESENFDNWSDAQDLAASLGSDTEFPDEPLEITAPGEESGTYDSFIELALGDIIEAQGTEEATRPDYSSQADDTAIIQGIEGSDSSFGWVGFAFAEGAGDSVKEVAISAEPGGECIEPSAETIADGSYPLSRPLFIYVNATAAEGNSGLEAYVDYYLGDGYSAVEEVGYVALPEDQLDETRSTWEDRTTGSSAA